MIKAISISAISLALLGFNNAAHADITEMDSPRIYTGIGYGQYSFEFEDACIIRERAFMRLRYWRCPAQWTPERASRTGPKS